MQDGAQGKRLVAWLNMLPEVRAVLALEFGGKPIGAQNLTEWRQGGYRDWLAGQEAREVAQQLGEEAVADDAEGRRPLTETLARWVAARYAVATRRVAEAEGDEGWRLLREMCGDVVDLRRGDHSAQRLDLERERVAVGRNDAEMKWKRKIIIGLEALVTYAGKHPEAQAALDELARLTRHPFDPRESNPIKPNQTESNL
ncbi:MAG: hypothetical protein ABJF10_16295 [Chthoniobacter sp.]|uniref:hypothetical protein n=1 Tax=Chthoniobacter sp. TaxID=2510640 RepID=UPI0032ADE8B9